MTNLDHKKRKLKMAPLNAKSSAMKKFCLFFIPLICFANSAAALSKIVVDSDGGYKNIVVKIDDKIPEENCRLILTNLKTIFTSASFVLNSALSGRVHFKSITAVVPSHWKDSSCDTVIRGPKGDAPYRTADIKVTSGHPVHGDEPFVQQSRGCGQSGDFASIPFEFLRDLNSTFDKYGRDPSKILVSEWSKFRYGIFDEFGYPGDRLYPNYFVHNGQLLPTASTDRPLNGRWIKGEADHCNPLNEECLYAVSSNNGDVTCSLGYKSPNLFNVSRFCDKADLDKMLLAPTKHNTLCEGKSARQIIDASTDFRRINLLKAASKADSGDLIPTMQAAREPRPQYVLVIETSASMDRHEQWKWINKAAQKFIRYDLPVNTNVAIVTFNNHSKIEHGLIQVTGNQVRARLADAIPDKYHLSRSSDRCVLCAVQKVVHEVLGPETLAGTHVVLVTRGSPDSLSITDERIVRNYVKDYSLKLSTIIVPQTPQGFLPFFDETSRLTGGRSYLIGNDQGPVNFYVGLNEAFGEILRSDAVYPTEMPEVLHKQTFSGGSGALSTGSFVIDSTLGRDTLFGIYVEDEEEHRIKSVSFTDAKGSIYGPFYRMSSSYDLVNFKTINFPSREKSPPFNAPHLVGSVWRYTIEWFPSSGVSSRIDRDSFYVNKNVVIVTSKPKRRENSDDLIVVHTWTNQDLTQTLDEEDKKKDQNSGNYLKPLAVYAQVTKGGLPVLGARVKVSIIVDEEKVDLPSMNKNQNGLSSEVGGEPIKLSPVEMVDDGIGDPDIVAGDGVYSRYITSYPAAGRYEFVISVDDNDAKAFVVDRMDRSGQEGSSDPPSPPPCCGSSVAINKDQIRKSGIFSRSNVRGPIVYVRNVPDHSVDPFPPAKIGDLKISVLPGSDNLLASWTAPGGDYIDGAVSSYRFVFAETVESLIKPDSDEPSASKILLGFDRLEKAGTQSTFDFEFPHYGRDFYVGAYGFDKAGNRGRISNLVRVRIDKPKNELIKNSDATKAEESEAFYNLGASDFDWIMIGAITGIIGVLLLVAIVAMIYYCVKARKRRIAKKKSTRSISPEDDVDSLARTKKVTNGKGHRDIGPGSTSSSGVNSGGSSTQDETDSSSFDSDIKHILAETNNHNNIANVHNVNPPNQQQNAAFHHNPHNQHINAAISSGDSGVSSHHATPTEQYVQHQIQQQSQQNTPGTPVYWSASQLLSKLDAGSLQHTNHHAHQHSYLGPYTPASADTSNSNYVPIGPHSLQPQRGFRQGSRGFTPDNALRSYSQEWDYNLGIPEEYTITVTGGQLKDEEEMEDIEQQQQQPHQSHHHQENPAFASRNNYVNGSARKVPPPVMPKPRNITQV